MCNNFDMHHTPKIILEITKKIVFYWIWGPELYRDRYRTQTVRLSWWDFSEDGDYFITIRTHVKGNMFEKILNDDIVLNIRGKIVQKYILEIPDHFANVILRCWVIMPDHVHFVLRIRNKRKLVDTQH
jgi:hypothetical protein